MREVRTYNAKGAGRNTGANDNNVFSFGKPQAAEEEDKIMLLHKLAGELSEETAPERQYQKIVDAAVAVMSSKYASMQLAYPDDGGNEKLHIVATHGFSPEALKYWEWVYHYTGSSCGEVLRIRRRVTVPDFRTSEFMQDMPTLPVFIEGGIYAAQSTPLYSSGGKLTGMLSTHWDHPHTPSQREMDMLDILAGQAAGVIER